MSEWLAIREFFLPSEIRSGAFHKGGYQHIAPDSGYADGDEQEEEVSPPRWGVYDAAVARKRKQECHNRQTKEERKAAKLT